MHRDTSARGLLLLAGILLTVPVPPSLGAAFCVAPNGDDTKAGTKDRPFRSIARAQQAVRECVADGLVADVRVNVRPGLYELSAPLTFGPADSGNERFAITYAAEPGAEVVLSGGRRIDGWRRDENGIWIAHIPGAESGRWHFRQLFVNGRRAVRARTPNATAKERYWQLLDGHLSKDGKSHSLSVASSHLQRVPTAEDLEVVVLKNWATLHKRVQGLDRDKGMVVLEPPHVKYFSGNRPRRGCAFFFENAMDFLDEPGEWYLERRTGRLFYLPRPGEDMHKARVLAPRLTGLLSITGEPGKPVRHLHFRGLTFAHAELPLPKEGHHGRQACFRYGLDNFTGRMPSAIRWRHVTQSSLVGCRIAHVGGGGVDLEDGCHENVIEGNEVWDVAGNGIGVGGRNDVKTVPKGNRVLNNHVHHCGTVYFGACGIWIGFAQKTLVSHNLVCHLPYTGISFGWQWNADPTSAREYTIEYNHVFDVMGEVSDGGALYSLGNQPGTIVRYNHLHDVHRSKYAHAAPNNGIFFDQGSKSFLVHCNVIYNTSGKPIRFNQCKETDHTWRDNQFGVSPEQAEKTDAHRLAGLEEKSPQPVTRLRVLTFNILHGGTDLGPLENTIRVIRRTNADIVGLQEQHPSGRAIAKALDFHCHIQDRSLAVLSRYPIEERTRHGVTIRLSEKQTVAVLNSHFSASPYGPYILRDHLAKNRSPSEAELIDTIREGHGQQLAALLQAAAPHLANGTATFLTGDFNEPSHLDWTAKAAAAGRNFRRKVEWPSSKALTAAGFMDGYRTIHPDEVKHPGPTWTPCPGPDEVHDRIDLVYFAGKSAKLLDARIVGESKANADVVITPWPTDHRAVLATFDLTARP